MDPTVIFMMLIPILLVALLLLLLIRQRSSAASSGDCDGGASVVAAPTGGVGGGGHLRQRRAVVARNRARPRMIVDDGEADDDNDDDDNDDNHGAAGASVDCKMGAKKLAKLQAKADRRTQRENELREREEKKERQERADADARERQAQTEQREAERLEKERTERAAREQREHEEYVRLRAEFAVDEEGFDERAAQDSDNLLEEFISHVKRVKVVLLEDLASQFSLKTQDTIDRLQSLIQQERLTGVIDDRGKFIYIEPTELRAVAEFVRERGRVSLCDLVENSNSLISLQPETLRVSDGV